MLAFLSTNLIAQLKKSGADESESTLTSLQSFLCAVVVQYAKMEQECRNQNYSRFTTGRGDNLLSYRTSPLLLLSLSPISLSLLPFLSHAFSSLLSHFLLFSYHLFYYPLSLLPFLSHVFFSIYLFSSLLSRFLISRFLLSRFLLSQVERR